MDANDHLDLRTEARIGLYLAARSGERTQRDAQRVLGRAAGLNGAEMQANEQGTSHDARGTACLRYVRALLAGGGAAPQEETRRIEAAGFRPAQVAAIEAMVRAHGAVPGIDSPREMVNCGQMNSPQPQAV